MTKTELGESTQLQEVTELNVISDYYHHVACRPLYVNSQQHKSVNGD